MIALKAIAPEPERQVERVRVATRRRFRRAQRRGYVAFFRISGCVAVLVLPVLLYVMLTANLTSLNYRLAHVQARKTALLAETMRQEDRIAKLESRDRLAAIAARLGMRDPQLYGVAELPAPPPPRPVPQGIALLGAVNNWLNAAARDGRP
jgi:hypothetical protein